MLSEHDHRDCDSIRALASTTTEAWVSPASQRTVVAISSLGHTLCHMAELAITGALVAIRYQFDLDPRTVTSLPYLGYVLLGLGAIPVGLAVDCWGAARLLCWYYFALALAASMVALAQTTWMLFVGLTLLGIVLSIYHPAGTALISVGISRREWAMGVNGVAGSLGVSLGPLIGGLWASSGYWQGAFWTIAAISLLGGCWARTVSAPLANCLPLKTAQTASTTVVVSARSLSWLAVLLLYVCMMLGGLNYRTFVTSLPIYLTGDATQAAALAKGGLFSFAVLLAGTIGQYTSGTLAQRFGAMSIYTLAISLMVPLSSFIAWSDYSTISLLLAGMLAISLFAQQPVENSLLAEGTSAGRRGLSYGAKFALTFGIGAAGAPLVGLIWHYGSEPRFAFWLVAISALIMLLAILSYRHLSRRVVQHSA